MGFSPKSVKRRRHSRLYHRGIKLILVGARGFSVYSRPPRSQRKIMAQLYGLVDANGDQLCLGSSMSHMIHKAADTLGIE